MVLLYNPTIQATATSAANNMYTFDERNHRDNLLIEELKNTRAIINQQMRQVERESSYLNGLDKFSQAQMADLQYYIGKMEAYAAMQAEISKRIIELKSM